MTTKTKVAPSDTVSKPYEPTPRERDALKAHLNYRETKAAPRIKVAVEKDTSRLTVDHPDVGLGQLLLMQAIGAKDVGFYEALISQLADASRQGRTADERGLNFMLSVVKSIEPRDQIEAMLAAQMAAVHNATMTFARRLNHVENIPQQDSAERAFNKLARTFASQVEALKRYRARGEQKVTVEHVHVHAGGQAVVGTIEAPGGGHQHKSRDQPHAKQIAHAPEPALPSPDAGGDPVQIASDAERALPDARRTVAGRAQG
jgi:hypothetical protein